MLTSRALLLATALFGSSFVAACSDEGTRPEPSADAGSALDAAQPEPDDGEGAAEQVALPVTPQASAELALSSGAQIRLPAGAVVGPVTVVMQQPADSVARRLEASLASDQRAASIPYVLTPHGTTFQKDVVVTLPIASASVGKPLQVLYLENEDDTEWELLGSAAVEEDRATFSLRHFSVLMLIEAQIWKDGGAPTAANGSMDAGRADGEVTIGIGDASLFPWPQADATLSIPLDAQAADNTFRWDAATISEQLASLFHECGMVVRQGEFKASFGQITRERDCEVRCGVTLGCTNFRHFWCSVRNDVPVGARRDLYEFNADQIACYAKCLQRETLSCRTGRERTEPTLVCDGNRECEDGADERDCPPETYFVCANGEKVPANERCNGDDRCDDGSDEQNCQSDGTFFVCDGNRLLPRHRVCDVLPDCEDESDEANCAGKYFSCPDQTVSVADVCDSWPLCADQSDEPTRCLKLNCN